jgi:hypothetical protein
MLEARVKELQNEAHRDSTHNESLNARLVHFLRKEAAEKEAVEEDDNDEEDSRPCHWEVATMTAPSALSDFLESCVG